MLSLCLVIQRGMRVTPSGFCLRVILNEKSHKLEKATSSVLSVLLLIYRCNVYTVHRTQYTLYALRCTLYTVHCILYRRIRNSASLLSEC